MKNQDVKRYRNLANRNRKALLKEKADNGYYNDGGGKRYRIGVYYLLAGAHEEAQEYFTWYGQEFPDDTGEPAALVFWALAEYRCCNITNARHRLIWAMLSNLYLLPYLFDEPIEELDIKHFSNRDRRDYLWDIETFLEEPSPEERTWIKSEYHSTRFVEIRDEYIRIHQALNHESDHTQRRKLLECWRTFEDTIS